MMVDCLCLSTSPLEDALLARMDASEIHDRIHAMRLQEDYYCVKNYLKSNRQALENEKKPVDAACRVKMSEWCYQVVDFCKFRRETVSIGMSFLDRYLSVSEPDVNVSNNGTTSSKSAKGNKSCMKALRNRKEYQLAAMTCLYMAIKIHEPLEMETSLLADLSRGCYSSKEIASMERTILMALYWRLQGPTPLTFVQHFLALLPDAVHPAVTTAIMDYARFQTELAVAEYQLVGTKYSLVALACILNAIEGMDRSMLPLQHQGIFLRAVEKFSGLMVEKAQPARRVLNRMLANYYANQQRQHSYPLLDEQQHHHLSPSSSRKSSNKSSRRKSAKTKPSSPISVASGSTRTNSSVAKHLGTPRHHHQSNSDIMQVPSSRQSMATQASFPSRGGSRR